MVPVHAPKVSRPNIPIAQASTTKETSPSPKSPLPLPLPLPVTKKRVITLSSPAAMTIVDKIKETVGLATPPQSQRE